MPDSKIIREEVTEMGGDVISKKTITEVEGSTKSTFKWSVAIDSFAKLIGLIVIGISILAYSHQLKEDRITHDQEYRNDSIATERYTSEIIRQYTQDSVAALKYRYDLKEQQYKDSLLNAHHEEEQRNYQNGLEIQNSALAINLSAAISRILLQDSLDKMKEDRQFYTRTIQRTQLRMDNLLKFEYPSSEYSEARSELDYVLAPDISFLSAQLQQDYTDFIETIDFLEVLGNLSKELNSVEDFAYDTHERLYQREWKLTDKQINKADSLWWAIAMRSTDVGNSPIFGNYDAADKIGISLFDLGIEMNKFLAHFTNPDGESMNNRELKARNISKMYMDSQDCSRPIDDIILSIKTSASHKKNKFLRDAKTDVGKEQKND